MRVAAAGARASDFCAAAAEELLTKLAVDRSTIDAVVFVSQTPDRVMLEVSIYERRGDEEVVVSQPRLIALSGEATEIVVGDDARKLRLAIKAQVNPPQLPAALVAR